MKKAGDLPQVRILIGIFIISRIITHLLDFHLKFGAVSVYWQYLNIETLKHHLLRGIWYDHAQPPVFNFILGILLKTGGSKSAYLFNATLKLISLTNGLLLFFILRKILKNSWLPLIVSIIYLMSPATLIFECELFYTTTISLFLLISVFSLVRLSESPTWFNTAGFFFPLVLCCLTRSIYHIAWLFVISIVLLLYFRKSAAFRFLLVTSTAGLLLVACWYVKNEIIFGKFTTSTWVGMNLARNVFHDQVVQDSGKIESYEPFSDIKVYRKFIDRGYEKKFSGLNDQDLLMEYKSDTNLNLNNVSYIPVSDMYLKASLNNIKTHPAGYLKNIVQSSILYFTPATIYTYAIPLSEKIKYYDIPYSFNLTHFANSKSERRILLTLSAIPKMLLYLFVFFVFIRHSLKERSITVWNLFILLTIVFLFSVGSLFEHYENMRFRFETEPLFMILAVQVFSRMYVRWRLKGKRLKPISS